MFPESAATQHGVELFLVRGAGFSTRRSYKGLLSPDGSNDPRMCPYTMQFEGFNTFVADVKLTAGCFYYELQVLDGTHVGDMWSREQFAKPEGTVSLHVDWGPSAHLICGDFEASAEFCNGRPVYYKRAGANVIIRYVFSATGAGAWAVQLVKPSGDAWTAAELQTDMHLADCEGRNSNWSVFDGKSVCPVTSPALNLKVRVWRRPAAQHQARLPAFGTTLENECSRAVKVQMLPAFEYYGTCQRN